MKYFSLFSGIGGFENGIQKAIPEAECVGYSETNKYAVKIYEKHFPGHRNFGDATKIVSEEIPEFEMLVARFPCQAFSVAGKRRGFDDSRGTLFFEIARILRNKRPRHFLLENVKGLLSHEEGKTFQTIIGILADLGYQVEWQILNSKHFGVPQNRERVFIIGHLGKGCCGEVFPIRGESKKSNNSLEEEQRSGEGVRVQDYSTALRAKEPESGCSTLIQVGKLSESDSLAQRVYDPDGMACSVRAQGGGQGAKTGLYVIKTCGDRGKQESYLSDEVGSLSANPMSDVVPKVCEGGIYAMRGREEGQELEYRGDETNALTGVQKDNLYVESPIMNTLTEATGNRAGSSKEFIRSVDKIHQSIGKIRRLTPTECERLQGFPDGWTEGISDTQRYKCLGNAVTVNVIEAIMQEWMEVEEG